MSCWSSSTLDTLCLSITWCLGSPQNRTGPNYNEQSGLQRRSSGLTFPTSRTCTGLGVSANLTHTGHKLLPSGQCCNLQKPATTETDSSHRLSLLSTLSSQSSRGVPCSYKMNGVRQRIHFFKSILAHFIYILNFVFTILM